MSRTIVEGDIAAEENNYVWFNAVKIKEITLSSGKYKWTVKMQEGTVSLNELPLGIDLIGAQEIIRALEEIMPMLKADKYEKAPRICQCAEHHVRD